MDPEALILPSPEIYFWKTPARVFRKRTLQDRAAARRRRFALPKGRRLPNAVFPMRSVCPVAAPLTQQKLDTLYQKVLKQQMENDHLHDKIREPVR